MGIVQKEIIPLTGPDYVLIASANGWTQWNIKGVKDDIHALGLQENVMSQCKTREDLLVALSVAIELGQNHWSREATDKVRDRVPYVVHGKGCGAASENEPTEQSHQSRLISGVQEVTHTRESSKRSPTMADTEGGAPLKVPTYTNAMLWGVHQTPNTTILAENQWRNVDTLTELEKKLTRVGNMFTAVQSMIKELNADIILDH